MAEHAEDNFEAANFSSMVKAPVKARQCRNTPKAGSSTDIVPNFGNLATEAKCKVNKGGKLKGPASSAKQKGHGSASAAAKSRPRAVNVNQSTESTVFTDVPTEKMKRPFEWSQTFSARLQHLKGEMPIKLPEFPKCISAYFEFAGGGASDYPPSSWDWAF